MTVADVLEREGDDLETHVGEVGDRHLLHRTRELIAVPEDSSTESVVTSSRSTSTRSKMGQMNSPPVLFDPEAGDQGAAVGGDHGIATARI